MRGGWLGLIAPSAADQKSWTLAEGDELLLGSDGAFDHLDEAEGAVRLGAASASLLDDVQGLLREALRQGPQKDDITLVLLRRRLTSSASGRREPADAVDQPAHAGRSPQSGGADDVSV